MSLRIREALTAYGFMLPFIVSLVIFFGFAFARTVYFSFTDYNLFNEPRLVGLSNYAEIIGESRFRIALVNTLLFALIVTSLQTVGALLLAVVLNRKLRGLAFFRTAYYMPSITSSVVITLIFIWLFQPLGFMSFFGAWFSNNALVMLAFLVVLAVVQGAQVAWERSRQLPAGLLDPALLVTSVIVAGVLTWALVAFAVVPIGTAEARPLQWLSTRDRFLGLIPYPLLVIIIQNTFTTVPTLMLFFLAGLQGVPTSLYEAASIDGANPAEQMRHITIPTLRPVTFYVVTVGLIGTLQMFDQVSLLSTQGTTPLESVITLAYYVYNNVFAGAGRSFVGTASAAALILGAVTVAIVLLQRRFIVSDEGVS